jgi:hypothetical protein
VNDLAESTMQLRHHNTKSKPTDSFRRQRESWHRAYAEATGVRERFPHVEQLVMELAFTDARAIGWYSPQLHGFSGAAKAFFAVACPRTLCLDGGFDLDSLVRNLLDAHGTSSRGTVECHGWTDPARHEQGRCLLQVHYQLRVIYDGPKPVNGAGRR